MTTWAYATGDGNVNKSRQHENLSKLTAFKLLLMQGVLTRLNVPFPSVSLLLQCLLVFAWVRKLGLQPLLVVAAGGVAADVDQPHRCCCCCFQALSDIRVLTCWCWSFLAGKVDKYLCEFTIYVLFWGICTFLLLYVTFIFTLLLFRGKYARFVHYIYFTVLVTSYFTDSHKKIYSNNKWWCIIMD